MTNQLRGSTELDASLANKGNSEEVECDYTDRKEEWEEEAAGEVQKEEEEQ